MNSSRRRKKRTSSGLKTVDICRGRNGFGFTISGQFPCKLSCVVRGSPADEVGLKPGDYLISVNGVNVVKTLHDDVVHLIGSSEGALHLQISDSYFSDTSDEDCAPVARMRPRYPGNKTRHRLKHASLGQLPSSSVSRNAAGEVEFNSVYHVPYGHGRYLGAHHAVSESVLHQTRRSPRKRDRDRTLNVSSARGHLRVDVDSDNPRGACASVILMRSIVGYLGTIGMPKDTHLIPNTRLQAVRNCIRRLRIEKKVHTLVLFSVLPDQITLQNPHGMILASYPSDLVTFCGAYADDNKFFGIVTRSSSGGDTERANGAATPPRKPNTSSSCHVFMVDAKMHFHTDHVKRARAFKISCTRVDPEEENYQCAEFPSSAGPILQSITKHWGRSFENASAPGLVNDSPGHIPEPDPHASPQPSLTSTNSSNSDSGIGFRDDAVSCAEREGVFDCSGSIRGAEAFPIEFDSALVESCGSVDRRGSRLASSSSLADRLCIRAMPSSPSSSSLLGAVKSPGVDRLSAQVFSNGSTVTLEPRPNMNFTRSLDDIRDPSSDTSKTCSGDLECLTYPLEGVPPPLRFGPTVGFHGSESNLDARTGGGGKKETNVDDLFAVPWGRYAQVPGSRAAEPNRVSPFFPSLFFEVVFDFHAKSFCAHLVSANSSWNSNLTASCERVISSRGLLCTSFDVGRLFTVLVEVCL